MKNLLGTFVLLFIFLSGYAQKPKAKFGAEAKSLFCATNNYQTTGPIDGSFYITYVSLGNVFIEKGNNKGRFEWFKKLGEILPKLPGNIDNEFFYTCAWNNKLTLIYKNNNRKTKTMELMYYQFDGAGNEVGKGLICEIPYGGEKELGNMEIKVNESPDGKNIAVLISANYEKSKAYVQELITFNFDDLENLTRVSFDTKLESGSEDIILDVEVNNEGKAAAIVQYRQYNVENLYHNYLVTSDKSENKAIKYLGESGFKFVNSNCSFSNKGDKLLLAGLFLKEGLGEATAYQGFYSAMVDFKSLEFSAIVSKGLDEAYMNFIDADYKKRKEAFQLRGWYYPEIYSLSNGNTYVVFQHNNTNYYSDLMVMHLNQSFELTNSWNIPKQYIGAKYNGYYAHPYQDQLFLFYLANAKSLDAKVQSEDKSMMKVVDKNSAIVYTHLSPEKESFERKKFFISEEKGGTLVTKLMKPFDDKIWFKLNEKKNLRYGVISIVEDL